ncbi:hypothetical protein MUN82_21065 [Hymenobacter aerilatus]|uniref:STAS/SEC14 domain-containing protein n=1 Tax=Hymenobacter aerilatus TaxID=2932251 RepID=A0A8T9SWQ4_9BACT|nr:hypothetical protein [Hymenobacter aerilatus]UOR05404.1 hypothetical protein MUN82_21065 [Hymenobacter aerilatus]
MLSPTCSIAYRPDLGALIVRWPTDAPFPTLQDDFEAILAVAEQHGTARWLLDVRRRAHLNPQLGDWTTRVFFPRAAARLAPQPLRLSVLCSPARMAVYAASAEQQSYLDHGIAHQAYQMHLVCDEGKAMEWLLE